MTSYLHIHRLIFLNFYIKTLFETQLHSVLRQLSTMEQWQGKVAVVTGASTGIGAAITLELVKNGMIVVGMARRVNKIEELKPSLTEEEKTRLHSRFCDITSEDSIKQAFDWVEKQFGGIDVLVNNAGVIKAGRFSDAGNSEAIRANVDTNFVGVVFCTRQVLLSLEKREANGHIVNINSIWGHYVPKSSEIPPVHNVYAATKFAITGFCETLRQELDYLKRKTKVTSISPGATATDRLRQHFSEEMLKNALQPEDIAKAVKFALATPANVQVTELTIQPTGEKL